MHQTTLQVPGMAPSDKPRASSKALARHGLYTTPGVKLTPITHPKHHTHQQSFTPATTRALHRCLATRHSSSLVAYNGRGMTAQQGKPSGYGCLSQEPPHMHTRYMQEAVHEIHAQPLAGKQPSCSNQLVQPSLGNTGGCICYPPYHHKQGPRQVSL